LAEPFVVEEEVVLMLLLRVEGVAGMEGSSVWNSGANSGPTLAPRELARVVTILAAKGETLEGEKSKENVLF